MRTRFRFGLVVALAGLPGVGNGEEWPQFRGTGGTGLSAEKGLPAEWSADKNVKWTAKVRGRGWAQPVVWGDKVFILSAFSEQEPKRPMGGGGFGGGRPPGGGGFGRPKAPDITYQFEITCLDLASGKEVWKKAALESKPKIPTHGSNTYASETPATDGERVYAYFGMHGVYCYDFAGKLVWKKDLGSHSMQMGWGTSSSPVLDGERLFVQVDSEEKSFLVALDKKTGDEKWRVSRTERSTWGSPILWKNKSRTELIAPGSRKVISYEPATGKVLWELNVGGGRASASPVGDDEHLYVGGGGGPGFGGGGFGGGRPPGPGGGGGFGGGMGAGGTLFAVKAGASGDVTPKSGSSTSDGVAWSQPKAGPSMASPLSYQ